MSVLGWILLVLGLLLLATIITLTVKFWDKVKSLLLKLKTIDWVALYEKAQKSGALDKAVDFVNSRKKKN